MQHDGRRVGVICRELKGEFECEGVVGRSGGAFDCGDPETHVFV
jgi:hypothetical protein